MKFVVGKIWMSSDLNFTEDVFQVWGKMAAESHFKWLWAISWRCSGDLKVGLKITKWSEGGVSHFSQLFACSALFVIGNNNSYDPQLLALSLCNRHLYTLSYLILWILRVQYYFFLEIKEFAQGYTVNKRLLIIKHGLFKLHSPWIFPFNSPDIWWYIH